MRAWSILLAFGVAACGADTQTQSSSSAVQPALASEQSDQKVSAAPNEGAWAAVAATGADIAVGASAPAFELPGSDGASHRLGDYAGRYVVLAFFPKAFTGG